MMQDMLLPVEDTQPSADIAITPPLERRGVQNQGGFLTPYYLFELLGRQHGDELDPQGREPNRRLLKRVFRQAMRGWNDLASATSKPTFSQTWNLWYDVLFQALGFNALHKLETLVETARHGSVPISHAVYLHDNEDEPPLLFVDLHPFGTDLDHHHYTGLASGGNRRHTTDITGEPISRAIEFALDHNQTPWTLLSNGLEMRLYRKGGSIARQYLKIDFSALFDNDDDKEWLAFWGIFRLAAFEPATSGTGRGRESKCLCPGNEFAQPQPGLCASYTFNGIDRDVSHLREIDDETIITDRVASRTMPATSYSHRKFLAASELHCTENSTVLRASNNEGRIAVNQSIPDSASTGVAIVARIEHFATKPGFELLKRSEVHAHLQPMPIYSVQ
jgi:hypothetical protein